MYGILNKRTLLFKVDIYVSKLKRFFNGPLDFDLMLFLMTMLSSFCTIADFLIFPHHCIIGTRSFSG